KVGLWLYGAVQLDTQNSPVEAFNSPQQAPKSIGHSYTLPRSISHKPTIFAWIRMLSEMVGLRLRQQNLAAKTLYLCLNSKAGKLSRQKTFFEPSFDSQEIYQRCLHILSEIRFELSQIRFIAVSASNFSPPGGPFLFRDQNRRDSLISAVDKINDRFGDWTVFPATLSLVRGAL
ncbi:MAG: hypothetical protein Q8N14_01840, partial [Candidatus Omnitrophota bacterium]|nr:hypothetical protein [Candidatus Omnitrophota bacterium]